MQANRSARSPRPVSVCSFTFADGRQCRLPRRTGHPYLCLFHAKKETQILSGEQAGEDIARLLTGNYISACDVAKSLARLFSAVAQGHIKPKTAATLAYLGQTIVQTLKLAQHEYINAFGTPAWRQTIASSFPPPPGTPISPSPRPFPPSPTPPPAPAKCSGGSLGPSPTTQPAPQPLRPSSPSPAAPSSTLPSPTPPPARAKCSGGSLDPSPDPSRNPQPTPPSQSSPSPTTTQPSTQPTAAPGTPISRLATPTPPPAPTPPSPQPNRRPDDDQYGITINGTKIIGRLRDF
jgi:hypothetical protein